MSKSGEECVTEGRRRCPKDAAPFLGEAVLSRSPCDTSYDEWSDLFRRSVGSTCWTFVCSKKGKIRGIIDGSRVLVSYVPNLDLSAE